MPSLPNVEPHLLFCELSPSNQLQLLAVLLKPPQAPRTSYRTSTHRCTMCLVRVTPAGRQHRPPLSPAGTVEKCGLGPFLSCPPNLPYFQSDSPYTCVSLKCVTPRAGEAEAREGKAENVQVSD